MDAAGPASPLGPGYGFAMDPGLSIYGNDDGVYVDYYARHAGYINHMQQVTKSLMQNNPEFDMKMKKYDDFLEDVNNIKNLKVLRIFPNEYLTIDVYISFEFEGEEFFGVYRKFNDFKKPKLDCDIFHDPRFGYIDKEYYLKLSNHLYKVLYNWFIPDKGFYINLKDDNRMKDELGRLMELKKGTVVEVLGYNKESDDKPHIILRYGKNNYFIENNDYFFFNYWFEKEEEK
jgi:hypothetical protein